MDKASYTWQPFQSTSTILKKSVGIESVFLVGLDTKTVSPMHSSLSYTTNNYKPLTTERYHSYAIWCSYTANPLDNLDYVIRRLRSLNELWLCPEAEEGGRDHDHVIPTIP